MPTALEISHPALYFPGKVSCSWTVGHPCLLWEPYPKVLPQVTVSNCFLRRFAQGHMCTQNQVYIIGVFKKKKKERNLRIDLGILRLKEEEWIDHNRDRAKQEDSCFFGALGKTGNFPNYHQSKSSNFIWSSSSTSVYTFDILCSFKKKVIRV